MVGKLVGAGFIIMRKSLFIYMLLCAALFALLGIAMNNMGQGSMAAIVSGVLGAYFLINSMFEAGHKYDEPVLLLTMPYTRGDVISGRFALFLAGMGILQALLFAVAALLSALGVYSLRLWLSGLCAALASGFIMAAVMIPIFVKWGYVAGRNVQLAAIMIIAVIWLLLVKSGAKISGIPLPLLPVVGAAGMVLSYIVSLKIMRSKQI